MVTDWLTVYKQGVLGWYNNTSTIMQWNTHPVKGIYLNPWLDPIACIAIQIIIIALHAMLESVIYIYYLLTIFNLQRVKR